MINGDQTGEVAFYGKGAGKEATASAVVADMMDCIRHSDKRKSLFWEDSSESIVEENYDSKGKLFILIKSEDFENLKNQFENLFPNIQSVKNKFQKEIAFITENDYESNINNKLSKFENITSIKTLKTMF